MDQLTFTFDQQPMPLVVHYGAGVDSTAMLVGMAQRGITPDLILFADVGAEKRPDDAGPRLDGVDGRRERRAVSNRRAVARDAAADGVARAHDQPHADAGAVAQTHADDVFRN